MLELISLRAYASFAMSWLAQQLSTELAHTILMSVYGSVQYSCKTPTCYIAKLASVDMVALKARYYAKCLAKLYNRARAATDRFVELVMFIEDNRLEEGIICTF